jgi:DNA/RNA-binding domain of Phe-tRNA-synthetase-like protein
VRDETAEVLIVVEALHAGAADDVPRLVAAIAEGLQEVWGGQARSQLLSAATPTFEFA